MVHRESHVEPCTYMAHQAWFDSLDFIRNLNKVCHHFAGFLAKGFNIGWWKLMSADERGNFLEAIELCIILLIADFLSAK